MSASAFFADLPALQNLFDLQRANRVALKQSSAQDRKVRLLRLREAIVSHVDEITGALFQDLRKMPMGLSTPEVGAAIKDIDDAMANLDAWMQPVVIDSGAGFGGNDARVMYEPRGVVLLFSAWNFPFGLAISPLVPIIAAGNACIVKPNELQPQVSAVVAKILGAVFPPNEVAVIEGGVDVSNALLALPFDHIFFTGSPAVGRTVMAAAAKHLSSVTLELGGKCPAVIDEGTDLDNAAAQIVRARFYNAGQLCLAVDHVWVRPALRDALIEKLVRAIQATFYVDGVLQKPRLSRIVNQRNFARVAGYLDDAKAQGAKVAFGGQAEPDDLTVHPTVLVDVPTAAHLMQEEIFGPILPVLTFETSDEIADFFNRVGKPLAMYLFGGQQAFIDELMLKTSSGGVTVNGVLSHSGEIRLPFGGVNQSGIGSYKGIHGFRELSHARSVFTHGALVPSAT
jgi:aldehyde dehydrogenase (NAD+)